MRRFLGWVTGLLLLAVIGAVVGAFVFDDRLRAEASDRVSDDLVVSVPFTRKPTITLTGYPLVWYLLTRNVPSVRIQAAELPIALDAATTLPLREVDVTLTGVTLGGSETRVAGLAGTGRFDYADLGRLAEAHISHASGDRIAFAREVQVAGVSFTGRLTGSAVLDPAAGTITLGDPHLDLAGVRVPERATAALIEQIAQPVAVPLPYGLRLDAVTPGERGVEVHITGTAVTFPVR